MNINFGATKGLVVGKKTTQSKDGNNIYYKLSIVIDEEAGMVSCSQEVYDFVESMKQYNMYFSYNETYKSLSLKRIVPADESNGPIRTKVDK